MPCLATFVRVMGDVGERLSALQGWALDRLSPTRG
jgi:hypothetical protein